MLKQRESHCPMHWRFYETAASRWPSRSRSMVSRVLLQQLGSQEKTAFCYNPISYVKSARTVTLRSDSFPMRTVLIRTVPAHRSRRTPPAFHPCFVMRKTGMTGTVLSAMLAPPNATFNVKPERLDRVECDVSRECDIAGADQSEC